MIELDDETYFSKAAFDMTQIIVVLHLPLKLRIDVNDCESQQLFLFKLVIQLELCLPPRVQRVHYLLSPSYLNPTLIWPADQKLIKTEDNFTVNHRGCRWGRSLR